MAEIALRTSEFLNRDSLRFHWRPRGSVVVPVSDARIRRKWIEILCDYPSKAKRATYAGRIPGFDKVCAAWDTRLLGEWIEFYRSHRAPFSEGADAEFWTQFIEPLGVLPDLPLDPTGLRPVWQTWLWSDEERRRFFIVTATASTNSVESMYGFITLAEDGTEPKPTFDAKGVQNGWDKAGVVTTPKRRLDYEKDIAGLKPETILEINDPSVVVHPRFDKPVDVAKVQPIPLAEVAAKRSEK